MNRLIIGRCRAAPRMAVAVAMSSVAACGGAGSGVASGHRPPAVYIYVASTDVDNRAVPGAVYQYSIGSDGSVAPLSIASVPSGVTSSAVVSDPSGRYVYAGNDGDATISGGDRRVVTDVRGNSDQVVCDVHLLESAYKNLLYNAMRFAKRDVRVTFEVGDSINRLTVEDDGPGIPIEDRERIFESFVQLQRGGEVKQGFGLGLAIVKRVMESHNGGVVVDTSPLGGARFTATWPASKKITAPA